MSDGRILALGEPMVEFNQTGAEGGTVYLQGFGGDTSNFAIAAARRGASTGVITALGDDRHGAMLRALWRVEGVDQRGVRSDADAFTAVYFVSHDADGHHFSFYRKGSAASRFAAADLLTAQIEAAQVLHLSAISMAISDTARATCRAAIGVAKRAGVRVSFDTNLRLQLWPVERARAAIDEVIGQADICLPSHDELAAVTGLAEPEALLDHCLRLGAKVVALKMGADGA